MRLAQPLGLRQLAACRWHVQVMRSAPRSFATTFGAEVVQEGRTYKERLKMLREKTMNEASAVREVDMTDRKTKTRIQLKKLFRDLPGQVSASTAFKLHQRSPKGKLQALEPAVDPPFPWEDFEQLFKDERRFFYGDRSREVQKRRRKRRNHFLLNTGYKEEDPIYAAEETEFTDAWRVNSIAEDRWKAEYYQKVTKDARIMAPELEPMEVRTDRFADVVKAAFRRDLAEQNRPVLTHEFADYENPYMMKRSALERVLAERCVRNQLDDRCLPRLLDDLPALVKLRGRARTPPEVLEPLAAFRGDGCHPAGSAWSFDARERLRQKLAFASGALRAIADSACAATAAEASAAVRQSEAAQAQAGDLHVGAAGAEGLRSEVPRGVAGGLRFGQPQKELDARASELRYPTMQRVAHTLPKDPKWRAHTARSIEVLERSKGWDYESKLRAMNSLKEVYDNLKSSDEYTQLLDEKLPLNRVQSHITRYARGSQVVKTFDKGFRRRKTFTRYRQSLTATQPLSKKSKK